MNDIFEIYCKHEEEVNHKSVLECNVPLVLDQVNSSQSGFKKCHASITDNSWLINCVALKSEF